MRPTGPTRLRRAGVAALAALALTLVGCSGDGKSPSGGTGESTGPDGSSSPSATPSNYLDVPKKVVLTPQGTELTIGEPGTVAWTLSNQKIAAVDLTVTSVERAKLAVFKAWKLPKSSAGATPYFVHAKVVNVGKANLGEAVLPVYALLRGEKTLVAASSFQSLFKPCPSTPLPKKFNRGKKVSQCWVYLVPEQKKLAAISFYTGPGFDAVTWTGPSEKYQPGAGAKGGKAGKKKGTKQSKGNN